MSSSDDASDGSSVVEIVEVIPARSSGYAAKRPPNKENKSDMGAVGVAFSKKSAVAKLKRGDLSSSDDDSFIEVLDTTKTLKSVSAENTHGNPFRMVGKNERGDDDKSSIKSSPLTASSTFKSPEAVVESKGGNSTRLSKWEDKVEEATAFLDGNGEFPHIGGRTEMYQWLTRQREGVNSFREHSKRGPSGIAEFDSKSQAMNSHNVHRVIPLVEAFERMQARPKKKRRKARRRRVSHGTRQGRGSSSGSHFSHSQQHSSGGNHSVSSPFSWRGVEHITSTAYCAHKYNQVLYGGLVIHARYRMYRGESLNNIGIFRSGKNWLFAANHIKKVSTLPWLLIQSDSSLPLTSPILPFNRQLYHLMTLTKWNSS